MLKTKPFDSLSKQIFIKAPPFPTDFTCAQRTAMGELEQLLDENKEWLERDGNVVHCRLTGHAMPLRADAVTQYMRHVCTLQLAALRD